MTEERDDSAIDVIRQDAFLVNPATGMGLRDTDPSTSISTGFGVRLTKLQSEELSRNWLCRKVCDAYPKEATREWTELTFGKKADIEKNQKLIDDFVDYEDRLRVRDNFYQALLWSNIYRGSAIVLNVEDGRPPNEPINKKAIKSIKTLYVVDCYKLLPDTSNYDPYNPSYYSLALDSRTAKRMEATNFDFGRAEFRVHPDRIIRFDAIELPPDAMMMNDPPGWGQSMIELIFDAFQSYTSGYASVNKMMNDFSIFIYSLKNLSNIVKNNNQLELQTRVRLMQKMMSLFNGLVIDADGEKIDFASRQFGGIADVIDRFVTPILGAADLPYTYVFGRGASGLTAEGTGDNEEMIMAKKTHQFQELKLRRKLKQFYELIWLAKDGPSGGKPPDGWGFKFKSLTEEDEAKAAEARSMQSSIDNTYIQAGVLLPEEIRASRFGDDEYSFETKLDNGLWKEKQDELKKQQELMNQGFGDFGGGDAASSEDSGATPPLEAGSQPPVEEEKTDSGDELVGQVMDEALVRFDSLDSDYVQFWMERRINKLREVGVDG